MDRESEPSRGQTESEPSRGQTVIIIINCIYHAPVPVLQKSSKHKTASHQTHNT